jgi:hypothetical protein
MVAVIYVVIELYIVQWSVRYYMTIRSTISLFCRICTLLPNNSPFAELDDNGRVDFFRQDPDSNQELIVRQLPVGVLFVDEGGSVTHANDKAIQLFEGYDLDLDSRTQHQKIERESVERLLSQIDDTRREWAVSTAQRIHKETELLRSEPGRQADGALQRTLKECTALMAAVCNGLRDEMCEMEMTERCAVARTRSPMRTATVGRAENAQPLL